MSSRRPAKTAKIIIPCGGAKAAETSTAATLYTGSAFTEVLAAAIAEVGRDNVLILSALHGLIELDDEIAPYDVKMGDAGAIDKRDGGLMMLAAQMICYGLHRDDVEVFGMLPAAYLAAADTALRAAGGLCVTPVYEATAGIGEHKAIAKGMRLAR